MKVKNLTRAALSLAVVTGLGLVGGAATSFSVGGVLYFRLWLGLRRTFRMLTVLTKA